MGSLQAAKDFISKNQKFIESDDFNKFISAGTTDKNSVISRINDYKEFLKMFL